MTTTEPAPYRTAPPTVPSPPSVDALPNLVVIGAMKCGTTALHRCLAEHPEIAMAAQKELNFFIGPADPLDHSATGPTWYRGLQWYRDQFDQSAPVRGESSPGYTSPDHPEAAARMSAIIPTARLVYLVRDPVYRAISQYRHHAAEGDETRPYEEALLDPESQYVSRGRYAERLAPFLEHYPTHQICVVAQEHLLTQPRRVLKQIFRFIDVDDTYWCDSFLARANSSAGTRVVLDRQVRQQLVDAFREDADRLRAIAGQDFPEWTV